MDFLLAVLVVSVPLLLAATLVAYGWRTLRCLWTGRLTLAAGGAGRPLAVRAERPLRFWLLWTALFAALVLPAGALVAGVLLSLLEGR